MIVSIAAIVHLMSVRQSLFGTNVDLSIRIADAAYAHQMSDYLSVYAGLAQCRDNY